MTERINHFRNLGLNTKHRKEWTNSVEELFSELLVDAHSFDPDMKMRFIEAFFYAEQSDIRRAMMDFDILGDADRLVAGYLLQSLARKARAAMNERRVVEIGQRRQTRTRPKRKEQGMLPRTR
jgi:hypothetical protein